MAVSKSVLFARFMIIENDPTIVAVRAKAPKSMIVDVIAARRITVTVRQIKQSYFLSVAAPVVVDSKGRRR